MRDSHRDCGTIGVALEKEKVSLTLKLTSHGNVVAQWSTTEAGVFFFGGGGVTISVNEPSYKLIPFE